VTEMPLAAIVLLGGCVQWLTGTGFALVAVPALVLRSAPRARVPPCAAAARAVPAGAWMTRQLPCPVLLLVSLGGFMNAAAGVGDPPVSLYALNAGRPVREFVPNAQFYGVAVTAFSIAANGTPRPTGPQRAVACAALTTGAVITRAIAGRVPAHRARHLVLLPAPAGGATTAMTKGVWGMRPG
jgi:uncharacterized protein